MKSNPSKLDLRLRRVLTELVDSGPLSLAELARRAGVSIPVMTATVVTLREKGLVHEVREESLCAGRPPMLYGLNGEAEYVMGMDLGQFLY